MSVDRDVVLRRWLDADRSATRAAAITVSFTLALVAFAATLPLWVREKPIVMGGAVYYNGTGSSFRWEFAAADAWWVAGLVLAVPALFTVIGAVRARRRLARAERDIPWAVDLSTIGGALSEAQRRAQVRSRQADLAARQQRFIEQNRSRISLWSLFGGPLAYFVGGWFLIGLTLDVTGATATPLGAWLSPRSWFLLLLLLLPWSALAMRADRRRLARSRSSAA
ncbi:hypothetical protein NQ156_05290 [Microbacterium sp. zg.Y625]|uniref:hypothetical protein n=1 Tax=Microbacterium jiangjiandongii TaxID=3049071 RepID=UPI00214C785D|nr:MULTISPECIES: hypothetical protein [unclassified Microbacterium]MCR2792475.1 hypothetical protein [Microbacterium sp. zg.Y625]WIM26467.1 hypothetical protein QNO14_05315 [Microbacterium sp. zg-Y625]